ncbi:MAG: phage portal protein [Variovorax paradoxus]|nr:MAG: phage portal protein [Variovorax paradoxus]PZQ08949.1 MAG: phage portal protein [Variovorax paradoxus]
MARSYSNARHTRTTIGFGGSSTSADAELASDLATLRSRSRQVIRDSGYAKRAKTVIVNNVIGTGVGMQAQVTTTRNKAATRINDPIERAWVAWMTADSCHTGGAMHFHDLERMAMGQVFEAGEIFIRKHYTRFGNSAVPLGLEVIEPERLASELVDPSVGIDAGHDFRMGIETDAFGRAQYYWIRRQHPGDLRSRLVDRDLYERVPAQDIFHLRVVDRWPQTRGEPWMHTALRKLDELNEYSQHEVSAARAGAAYFATLTTPEENMPNSPLADGVDEASGQQVMEIDSLTVTQLAPGEKLDFHTPNRPNAALDPFMRTMLREVAAGTGVSYESLSRDYSQSNYSSSRLALLDDRDLFKVFQLWWIRNFRMPLHKVWLQQAVLARAVVGLEPALYASDIDKYSAVLFKPRGWGWIDPTKEVAAYKEAIKAGLTTITDVVAATGGGMDIEDVVQTRKRELDLLAEAGVVVDTTVTAFSQVGGAPLQPPKSKADDEPAGTDDDEPAARTPRNKQR